MKKTPRQIRRLLVSAALWVSVAFGPSAAASRETPSEIDPKSIKFEHLTTDHGLSSNIIHAIFQDSRGFLWIGTDSGLDVYDGYTVVSFRHNPNDPTSLPGHRVTNLAEDASGTIWVGTPTGLGALDRKTGTFTQYRRRPRDPSGLSDDNITSMWIDRRETLWIGTNNGGLNRLNPDRRTFTRVPVGPTDGPRSLVSALREDRQGRLWVGTRFGIGYFDSDRTGFQSRFDRSEGKDLIRGILEDREGRILFIAARADFHSFVREFDPVTETFSTVFDSKREKNNPQFTGSMCEDDAGVLWVGTDGGGICLIDRGSEKTSFITHDPTRPAGLSGNFITALYRDRTGIMWVGTEIGGVNKHAPLREKFTLHRLDVNTPRGIPNNMIRGICKDRTGTLWVATQGGGLGRLDRKTDTWTVYEHDPNRPETISGNNLYGIIEDRDGRLWIGTGNAGFNRLDPRTGRFTRFEHDPNKSNWLPDVAAPCLAEDSSGTIWIGTNIGLSALDPTTGKWENHSPPPFPEGSVPQVSINSQCIFIDRTGTLWLGTEGFGVLTFDLKTRRWARTFRPDSSRPGSLSNNFVTSVSEDRSGTLWVTTKGGGVNRLINRKTGVFDQLKNGSALWPHRNTYAALEDENGNLWISSDNGIARWSPSAGTFKTYTTADGLQGSEFNRYSHFKSRDGELFFGGVAGLNSFYPNRLVENTAPPPVAVTAFKKFNDPVFTGPAISELNEIELTHEDNFLSFEFAALDFTAPQSNLYRYKLEGVDPAWIATDARRRFVNYTQLGPGDYVFRVVASNNDGVWNKQGAVLRFRIAPPWWKRWWMYVLYVGFGGSTVFLTYSYRVRQLSARTAWLERKIRERTAELDRKNEELAARIEQSKRAEASALEAREEAVRANRAKSVFLANMSHELRTPLNAVLGFVQVMQHKPERDREDREYLSIIMRSGEHLLGLINNVLSISKIEAGTTTLNETEFELPKLLEGLKDLFSERARVKGLTLDFNLSPELPDFVRGDDGKLRQVCINLLANAVKFTERGRVTFRAAWRDDRLFCEVEDTGCGIPPEEQGKLFEPFVQAESGRKSTEGSGLGLAISRNFVRLMGGDMYVRGTPGKGATFSFEVALPEALKTVLDIPALRPVGLEPDQPTYRMLIVDDKVENRLILKKVLSPFGFELREAADGREAVDCWDQWRPDFIWMDLRMPEMDGYEAVRAIRRLETQNSNLKAQGSAETPDPVKIVAVSASVFDHDRQAVLEAGCDGFVAKPFREGEVFKALSDYLGVRFVHANGGPTAAPEKPVSVLAPERLAKFPADWLKGLDLALELGDVSKAAALVESVRDKDEKLADELAGLIRNYRFEAIQDMLAEIKPDVN